MRTVRSFSYGKMETIRSAASLPAPRRPSLPAALVERLPPPLADALLSCITRVKAAPGEQLEEIRLRANRFATLTVGGRNVLTDIYLSGGELSAVLTGLCGGSLYACAQDIADGYLSLPDGIRVGVAGRAACENGCVIGLSAVTGLCIRLPHLLSVPCGTVTRAVREAVTAGSAQGVLLYGPPGVGKTTLLRAVARSLASPPAALRTAVIDTRRELAFGLSEEDLCLDVLSGYPRAAAVGIAVRTLNAQVIVADEIGAASEADALAGAHRGGVPVVGSAHAADLCELLSLPGIRLLHEMRLFGTYIGLERDGAGGFRYTVTPCGSPGLREMREVCF